MILVWEFDEIVAREFANYAAAGRRARGWAVCLKIHGIPGISDASRDHLPLVRLEKVTAATGTDAIWKIRVVAAVV